MTGKIKINLTSLERRGTKFTCNFFMFNWRGSGWSICRCYIYIDIVLWLFLLLFVYSSTDVLRCILFCCSIIPQISTKIRSLYDHYTCLSNFNNTVV